MFRGSENFIYISLVVVLVLVMMGIATSLLKRKQEDSTLREDEVDQYSAFVSRSRLVTNLNRNRLINRLGKSKRDGDLIDVFNKSKNPWGITPTIFRAMRTGTIIASLALAAFFFVFLGANKVALFVLIVGVVLWWYPLYYYKAIGKEREQEWDKIYEFIWVLKNSSMLYDAKKVCLETRDYIQEHYPHQKEIIEGFIDFHIHWEDDEIPEYILKYYNFPIPKELYTILYNMNISGQPPNQNLDNLRSFALNKHNKLIQKTLSQVPTKATIGTLPFLMFSVVIALLIPMMYTFLKLM